MESREQEFVIQLPRDQRYGPYVCLENVDIERHLLRLSGSSHPRIGDTPFRVKLPKSLGEHILVIVYPSSPSRPFDEPEPVVVYGVECGPGETLTVNEIQNRLRTSYATYNDNGRCFCVYTQSEANELTSTQSEYPDFQIFIPKLLNDIHRAVFVFSMPSHINQIRHWVIAIELKYSLQQCH